MVNYAGIFAAVESVFRPQLVRPALSVPDISRLNWSEFKRRGVRGIIIDKDNCITKPGSDELIPALRPSFDNLLQVFGAQNVLVVSNSSGLRVKDPALLQAESVSRNLGVPVLVHRDPKPAVRCATTAASYFVPSLREQPSQSVLRRFFQRKTSPLFVNAALRVTPHDPLYHEEESEVFRLLVIGDRITTDMVLASRLKALKLPPPVPGPPADPGAPIPFSPRPRIGAIDTVGVLTTSIHARERLGTMAMRSLENLFLRYSSRRKLESTAADWSGCLLPDRLGSSAAKPTRRAQLQSFTESVVADVERRGPIALGWQPHFGLRWAHRSRRALGMAESLADRMLVAVENTFERGRQLLARRGVYLWKHVAKRKLGE